MTDLTSYYNDPNIQMAAGESETASTQAAAYNSASALLPQKLKEAINQKMDYNKDIIEQKNKAMSEYFQAPSAARAKYGDPSSEHYIFNPFQQEQLAAQKRGEAYQSYANLVDILGERRGSLADIINAGTGAFQSQVSAQQGEAEIANQKFQNLLSIADRLTDARYKEASLAKGSGGGNDTSISEKLQTWILEDQMNADLDGDGKIGFSGKPATPNIPTPTEDKPKLSPQLLKTIQSRPNVLWKSPGGQWVYDQETKDYVPDLSALY